MLRHTDKNFQIYPTQRVVAMINDKSDADEAVLDLISEGFNEKLIDESFGEEGVSFLDPDGINHGIINRIIRKWQLISHGEEFDYIKRVKKNLNAGHTVVSIPATDTKDRLLISTIMRNHNAKDIRYYGFTHVENLN